MSFVSYIDEPHFEEKKILSCWQVEISKDSWSIISTYLLNFSEWKVFSDD